MSSLRRWHPEATADGVGFWLVGLESRLVHVIAPPAVALNRRAEPRRRNPAVPNGWRWAIWVRREGYEPSIDEDPPARVSEIDTSTVLLLIDDELREQVWSCLWAQLQIARQIGKRSPGEVLEEDLARAGALSATWLQRELARAFPERSALLEPNVDFQAFDQADPVHLIPSGRQTLDPPHKGASLRTIARWLTAKVGANDGDPEYQADDPGDHSEFDWEDVPSGNEPDPLTEEMLLP